MRHCGSHPLSLGYSTRSERDFPQLGFREPHTVPRAGTSIHHLPGRASQTAAFHLRLQKPEAQGRKGALNLANTRWLAGVGQFLEPLCTGSSTTPPQLPISHQHLVPWGQDSGPTSHHLRDPSHPRASSSPIESPITHLLPLDFTPLPYLDLCAPNS